MYSRTDIWDGFRPLLTTLLLVGFLCLSGGPVAAAAWNPTLAAVPGTPAFHGLAGVMAGMVLALAAALVWRASGGDWGGPLGQAREIGRASGRGRV